jgi:hypothetical protein
MTTTELEGTIEQAQLRGIQGTLLEIANEKRDTVDVLARELGNAYADEPDGDHSSAIQSLLTARAVAEQAQKSLTVVSDYLAGRRHDHTQRR